MNETPRDLVADAKDSPALQAIVLLVSRGESTRAMAQIRQIADKDVAIEAWRRMAQVNANLQRWSEAFSAIENALRLAPNSRRLRLDRALILEQQGDDHAALAELESLARDYSALRETYNEAVRKSVVTELLVKNGTLCVVVRNAAGERETIETPFDPSREIYVDYVLVDGRLR